MVGSAHTRRLATIVLAAACTFATSGCYVTTTTFGPGFPNSGGLPCPPGVDLGPGKISAPPDPGLIASAWQPAPTTQSLQFAVISADSTKPITVLVGGFPGGPSESFGVVWDGTHSTGNKSIPWGGTWSPFVLAAETPNPVHMTWWIMALDGTGKEVGFTGCVPWGY